MRIKIKNKIVECFQFKQTKNILEFDIYDKRSSAGDYTVYTITAICKSKKHATKIYNNMFINGFIDTKWLDIKAY